MDIKCRGFSCDWRHVGDAIRSLSHDPRSYWLQLSLRSATEGSGHAPPPATPCRPHGVNPFQTFPAYEQSSSTDMAFQALLVSAAKKDCARSETIAVAHCHVPSRFEPRMPGPPSSQRRSVARHLRAKNRVTVPVGELETHHGLLPSDRVHFSVPQLPMEPKDPEAPADAYLLRIQHRAGD